MKKGGVEVGGGGDERGERKIKKLSIIVYEDLRVLDVLFGIFVSRFYFY